MVINNYALSWNVCQENDQEVLVIYLFEFTVHVLGLFMRRSYHIIGWRVKCRFVQVLSKVTGVDLKRNVFTIVFWTIKSTLWLSTIDKPKARRRCNSLINNIGTCSQLCFYQITGPIFVPLTYYSFKDPLAARRGRGKNQCVIFLDPNIGWDIQVGHCF